MAGIVASDLRPLKRATGRAGTWPRTGRDRAPAPAAGRSARDYCAPGQRSGGVSGDLGHHLQLEEPLDHGALHALRHLLEQVEGFLLVLHQRVALTVAAEANALLEVIDGEQVILPLLIDLHGIGAAPGRMRSAPSSASRAA